MGKIIIFIVGSYVIYYIGQIIYDGFLAKPNLQKNDDEGVQINFSDLKDVEEEEVSVVSLEEVENLTIPNHTDFDIIKDDYLKKEQEEETLNFDTSLLQKRYEEENEEEEYYIKQIEASAEENKKKAQDIIDSKRKKSLFENHLMASTLKQEDIISSKSEVIKKDESSYFNFFDIAEKHTVVKHNDGFESYHLINS